MADTTISKTESVSKTARVTEPGPIFLITALPPSRSSSALIGYLIACTLSRSSDIICIVDDTSIEPYSINSANGRQISYMRVRDFRRAAHTYRSSPRLFILDDGFDSLFTLELYLEFGGAVITASSSLHSSVKALLNEQSDWPENYINHLNTAFVDRADYKAVGPAILKALLNGVRVSNALPGIAPFLHILEKDETVLALTLEQQRYLKREGIDSQKINLDLTANENDVTTAREALFHSSPPNIVIAAAGNAELNKIYQALSLAVTHHKKIMVLNLSEAHNPHMALLAADIIIADGLITRPIASLLRDFAVASNKHYIDGETSGTVNKMASLISLMATGRTIDTNHTATVRHPIDGQEAQNSLGEYLYDLSFPALKSTDLTPSLTNEDTKTASVQSDQVLPNNASGKALIIGPSVGPAILAAATPSLDTEEHIIRVATKPFAEALGNALGMNPKNALSRLGFESLILDTESNDIAHNPLTTAAIAAMLKPVDHIAVASHADRPCVAPHTHKLPLYPLKGTRFSFSLPVGQQNHTYDNWTYAPSLGMAWRIDHHRRVVHFLMILGSLNARLSLADPDLLKWAMPNPSNPNHPRAVNFVFAGETESRTLAENPIILETNQMGLYKGRIAAHLPGEARQLSADETLKLLQHLPFQIEFIEPDQDTVGYDNNDISRKETIMASLNSKLSDMTTIDLQPLPVPDKRLTNDAVRYADILLEAQRKQAEAHLKLLSHPSAPDKAPQKSAIKEANLFVENPDFAGTGWGDLAQSEKGKNYRWMPRIASVLIDLDLTQGGSLFIEGYGINRRRFLKTLNLFIGNVKISGKLKRTSMQSWHFAGDIPPIDQTSFVPPYQLLRFENLGCANLKKDRYYRDLGLTTKNNDRIASLGISRIEIKSKS